MNTQLPRSNKPISIACIAAVHPLEDSTLCLLQLRLSVYSCFEFELRRSRPLLEFVYGPNSCVCASFAFPAVGIGRLLCLARIVSSFLQFSLLLRGYLLLRAYVCEPYILRCTASQRQSLVRLNSGIK